MTGSNLLPVLVTFTFMIAFLIIERALRKDTASKTLEQTEHDKGTTRIIGVAFAISWIALLLSAGLNQFRIGSIHTQLMFHIIGPILMIMGISIRVMAARTLGRFYTRTLRTSADQHVVSSGIYQYIRHPGYLGDIILFIAAGITVSNILSIALILAVILPVYIHRINVEEQMLSNSLGKTYLDYAAKTKKLIPFIY